MNGVGGAAYGRGSGAHNVTASGHRPLSPTEILRRLRAEIAAPPHLRYIRLQWVRFQSDRQMIGLKLALLVALVVLAAVI